jgi:UDP-glucose 4-epimerase
MKILVTGGAGFIGSHLCKRLHEQGHEVQSLDNYFTGSTENHVQGVEYIRGDTREIFQLIATPPELIYHLGEYSRVEQSFSDMQKVLEFNKIGTINVVEFAKRWNCKLVYAGSSTKFGDDGDNADASPYAWSKSSNVQMIKNYGEWFNLHYAVVYFYNAYGGNEMGSGNYATLIAKFAKKICDGEQLHVVAPGTQKRNFTHIEDTVNALVLVGEKGTGDGYGIGSPDAYSVLEVAKMFTSEPIRMLPERKGNRMTAPVMCEKTRKLGWTPRKNLKDYIEEFRKIYN